MNQSKKCGSIIVALSIVLALAALTFSDNPCHTETPMIDVFLRCLHISIIADIPDVPTKFPLLACAALLAVGILVLKGALPFPSVAKNDVSDESTSQSPKNDA